MLVKDLLNWKELDDEQKASAKKKLADAAKIGAGFAAGVGAVIIGNKLLDSAFPMSSVRALAGEDSETGYLCITPCTKSGKEAPSFLRKPDIYKLGEYQESKDVLQTGVDFFEELIKENDIPAEGVANGR